MISYDAARILYQTSTAAWCHLDSKNTSDNLSDLSTDSSSESQFRFDLTSVKRHASDQICQFKSLGAEFPSCSSNRNSAKGHLLNEYRFEGEIGSGQFSRVYLANYGSGLRAVKVIDKS